MIKPLINNFAIYIKFSVLNEESNQRVHPLESNRLSDNKNKNKNSSSEEEKYTFNADLYGDDDESDDFYGKTREIIYFAEKGEKEIVTY